MSCSRSSTLHRARDDQFLLDVDAFESFCLFDVAGWGHESDWVLKNFQGDVDFLISTGFDSYKLDSCGALQDIALYASLIKQTGKSIVVENCHNVSSDFELMMSQWVHVNMLSRAVPPSHYLGLVAPLPPSHSRARGSPSHLASH